MLNTAIPQKLRALPLRVLALVAALGIFGILILYSAAGGSFQPWAVNHAVRFVGLFLVMITLSQIDSSVWIKYAYPFYAVVLVALIVVETMGKIGMGAQRWIDLGIIRIQPSEFMKIAIVLALARYYHFLPRLYVESWRSLWPPALMIGVPMVLVMLQPDLGTSLMIAAGGTALLFVAGVRLWLFLGAGAAVTAALPIAWQLMHDYQKKRVLIFMDPESDPLGAGYHITQSKIAIGSGGVFGKGFLNGTQSHLEYLPEQHTDFIFATMAEEWGLMGGIFLLLCFGGILAWGLSVALKSRSHFARLVAMGLTMTLFFYLFINMMMVMGLAPVVGIPLPLISYGGSAMMTVLIALGILMSIARQRDRPTLSSGPSSL